MTFFVDSVTSEGLLDHKSHRTQTAITTVSSGTLTLTIASEAIQVFQGSTAGQIVQLPSAAALTVGYRYQIHNDSTQNLVIKDGGANQIILLSATYRALLILVDTGSTAGTWSYIILPKLPQTPEQFLATYSGTGLSVSYTGGNAHFNGSFTQVAGGSIALPDSTTNGWLYVTLAGVVAATASLPDNALPLYKFTTTGGAVTVLLDMREDYEQNLIWGVDGDISAITKLNTVSAGTLDKYARADHRHAATLPFYKSGVVASGSFTGDPRTAAVTFSPGFADTNYSVAIIGTSDGRSWLATTLATGGFTINTQAKQAITGNVYWIAVAHGASV